MTTTEIVDITGLNRETVVDDLSTLGSLLSVLEKEAKVAKVVQVPFSELEASDGYLRRTKGGKLEIPFDVEAKRVVGGFLSIPVPYLTRISTGLAETNVEWHFRTSGDIKVELVTVEGHLKDMREPDSTRVTEVEVARILNNTLGADARVANIQRGLNDLSIDVFNPAVQTIPKHRLGDVTAGGLRVTLPFGNNAPKVGTYLHRLICTNGMFHVRPGDIFSIQGMTHDDILENLAAQVDAVYNRLPETFLAYGDLDDRQVKDPQRMIRLYALENGIPPRFMVEAGKRVDEFMATEVGAAYKWTLYDIVQVFTSLAHLDTAKANTRNKLMALGGKLVDVAIDERRCKSCQHLLDAPKEH